MSERREPDARLREEDEDRSAQSDREQSRHDQMLSDADQAAARTEQLLADRDQQASDRDQKASDRDQAAADWERTHTSGGAGAARAHQQSHDERAASSRERESTAARRARVAAQRLETAQLRDEAARARDVAAAARDQAAQERCDLAIARQAAAAERVCSAAEAGDLDTVVAQVRSLRQSSVELLRRAERERLAAAADREAAARDRKAAADERRFAGVDELTGALRRSTGELALSRELDRARRSGEPLVIAMIDVDALKAVNDEHGHAAGDELLRDVAIAIITTLRAYDVTVRWGGDEFVCAISGVTTAVARMRVASVQSALTRRRPGASISCGLAELQRDDRIESLIARADAALYRRKGARC